MASISTNTSPSGAAFIYRVVGRLEDAFETVVEWRQRQATMRELSHLSDHQLSDIGLERRDIASFASFAYR